MQKNEGTIDRVIRGIIGVIILYLSYSKFSGTVAVIGYVIGVIAIFTALSGFCCLYTLLGINTDKS
ncbi:MAG: DUF2892 domain-containing protein [Candidatus Moraniibacteriota bacterium]